jgi:hypothetical protein
VPRIRSIKPEFWDSPSTASASVRVRLLFIAMWNWADDHGRGTANASQVLSFAFPNDAELPSLVAEAPRIYTEIRGSFGVVFYEADGRRFYAIPSWNDHQKNERKAASKYPPPPEGITADQAPDWASVAEMRGTSAQTHGASGTGTGEQGNRGTGESTSRPPLQTELTTPAPRPPRKTGTDIVLDNVRALNTQTSRHAEAAAIVTEFGAWLGTPLDAKTATETTAIVESCLIAGQTRDEIAAGMVLWSPSDSWSPSQIPKFITKAAARRKHRGVGKPTEKAITVAELAAELIAEMETTE